MKEKLVGEITHYFGKIDVAIIKLKEALKEGDIIHVMGNDIDFTQTVSSMQVDHECVKIARKGTLVGLKMSAKVKEGAKIFLA